MPISEAQLNEHRELEKAIKEYAKDPSWQKDEPNDGIEIYVKTVKNPTTGGDIAAVLGVGEFRHSADVMVAAFTDYTLRLEWDGKNLAKFEQLEEIDAITNISFRISNNLPWPMSQRDTVNRSHESREADGSILFTFKGVEHVGRPPNSSYVRGFTPFGTFLAFPLTEKSCKVLFALAYDPCGNIPFAVMSKILKSAPLVVRELEKYLDNPNNFKKALAAAEGKRAKRAAAGINP